MTASPKASVARDCDELDERGVALAGRQADDVVVRDLDHLWILDPHPAVVPVVDYDSSAHGCNDDDSSAHL